jgi:hypothetical protein
MTKGIQNKLNILIKKLSKIPEIISLAKKMKATKHG